MKEILLGSFFAAMAIYIWGVIFWSASPLPQRVVRTMPDPVASGTAIVTHLPEPGVYEFPELANDDDSALRALHDRGPVALLHVDIDDRLQKSPGTQVVGFLHGLIAALLMALLLKLARNSLEDYGDRVVFVLLAGVIVSFWGRLAGVVWWSLPLPWQIWNAVYDVTTWLVAGMVLAHFVVPASKSSDRQSRG